MDQAVKKLRVLLLEDEPTDAELEEDALRSAGLIFTGKRVDTREAFIRALEEFKPDIVLADYKLPAFDGGAAVQIVRQQYPSIPVVMVTGTVGDEKAVELLGLGARDYILKDRLARLGPAVQHALSAEQGIRARKAAERALRESEERFRNVFENAKDVILAMAMDETLIMLNPAFERITGWKIEEWLGKPFAPLVHPDELPRAMELFKCAMHGEALPAFELQIIKNNGGYVAAEFTIAPLVRSGPRPYVIGIARDVTERKLAEERIRASEALLRQAQAVASVGSWRISMPGNELTWSDETYRMFGVAPGTPLAYESFLQYIHPDDRAKVEAAWQAALQGAPYSIQHRIVANGVTRWVEERAELEFDEHGNPRSATGAIQDITERRQMEDALKETSNRSQAIMETANDAIICMRPDGAIHLWNHKAETIFGFTAAEAIGQKMHELITPQQYRGKEIEGLRRFVKDGDGPIIGKMVEVSALRKDGSEFPVELSVSAMSVRGEWHATGIVRDITERKHAEARIHKLSSLYATLSHTNKGLVHATCRDELFSSVCESAVTHGKFMMAWVGLVDEKTRLVKPVCHYGGGEDYLGGIAVSAGDVPDGQDPTGAAIRENHVAYVNDYAADGRELPWRGQAVAHGFLSAAAIPLRFKNKVIGALTLYAGDVGFFDSEQLNLLEEMATDIAFALDGFERETLRRKAEEEREAALEKLKNALEDSIQVAASISEVRDPYTAGHQQRVSQLAVAIAAEMGLPDMQIEGIRFGSLIHDIGKIGVPAEILSKPSRLTPLEMELIQTHPRAGYEIVKNIKLPWPVAQMLLQHHERLDGRGYPDGLKEDGIIQEARIIAVADTVEAMSSHRPYRPGLGMDAALAEIKGGAGILFDKQAVDVCIRLVREKGFTFK